MQPLEALVQELQEDDDEQGNSSSSGPSLAELRAALLDCDLRKYGAGCLPDDVNRAANSSIKGPLVLQVCAADGIRSGGAVQKGWWHTRKQQQQH
jgi:hypothetical protein